MTQNNSNKIDNHKNKQNNFNRNNKNNNLNNSNNSNNRKNKKYHTFDNSYTDNPEKNNLNTNIDSQNSSVINNSLNNSYTTPIINNPDNSIDNFNNFNNSNNFDQQSKNNSYNSSTRITKPPINTSATETATSGEYSYLNTNIDSQNSSAINNSLNNSYTTPIINNPDNSIDNSNNFNNSNNFDQQSKNNSYNSSTRITKPPINTSATEAATSGEYSDNTTSQEKIKIDYNFENNKKKKQNSILYGARNVGEFVMDVTGLRGETDVGIGLIMITQKSEPLIDTLTAISKKAEYKKALNSLDNYNLNETNNILSAAGINPNAYLKNSKIHNLVQQNAYMKYFNSKGISSHAITELSLKKALENLKKNNGILTINGKKLSQEESDMIIHYLQLKETDVTNKSDWEKLEKNGYINKNLTKMNQYQLKGLKNNLFKYLKNRGIKINNIDCLSSNELKNLLKSIQKNGNTYEGMVFTDNDLKILNTLAKSKEVEECYDKMEMANKKGNHSVKRIGRRLFAGTDVYQGAIFVITAVKMSIKGVMLGYKTGREFGRGAFRLSKFTVRNTVKITTLPIRVVNKSAYSKINQKFNDSQSIIDNTINKINNTAGKKLDHFFSEDGYKKDRMARKEKRINKKSERKELSKLKKQKRRLENGKPAETRFEAFQRKRNERKQKHEKFNKRLKNKKTKIAGKLLNVASKIKMFFTLSPEQMLEHMLKGMGLLIVKLFLMLLSPFIVFLAEIFIIGLIVAVPIVFIFSMIDSIKSLIKNATDFYGITEDKTEANEKIGNKIISYINTAYRESVGEGSSINFAESQYYSGNNMDIKLNYHFLDGNGNVVNENGSRTLSGPPITSILAMTSVYYDDDFTYDDKFWKSRNIFGYAKNLTKKAIRTTTTKDEYYHTSEQIDRSFGSVCNNYIANEYTKGTNYVSYYYETNNYTVDPSGHRTQLYNSDGTPQVTKHKICDTLQHDYTIDDAVSIISSRLPANTSVIVKSSNEILEEDYIDYECLGHYTYDINVSIADLGNTTEMKDHNESEQSLENTLFDLDNADEGAEHEIISKLPKWAKWLAKVVVHNDGNDYKYAGGAIDVKYDGWFSNKYQSLADHLDDSEEKSIENRAKTKNISYNQALQEFVELEYRDQRDLVRAKQGNPAIWEKTYGISFNQSIGSLTESQIKNYMKDLSTDNVTFERIEMIKNALEYVGAFVYTGTENKTDDFEHLLSHKVGQVSSLSFINFIIKNTFNDYNFDNQAPAGDNRFKLIQLSPQTNNAGLLNAIEPGDIIYLQNYNTSNTQSENAMDINKRRFAIVIRTPNNNYDNYGQYVLVMADLTGNGGTTTIIKGQEALNIMKSANSYYTYIIH